MIDSNDYMKLKLQAQRLRTQLAETQAECRILATALEQQTDEEVERLRKKFLSLPQDPRTPSRTRQLVLDKMMAMETGVRCRMTAVFGSSYERRIAREIASHTGRWVCQGGQGHNNPGMIEKLSRA